MQNVTDKIVIEAINKSLAERGRSLDGRPIWRVSFAPEQKEKRIGEFTDWYANVIIIRVVRELRETAKYPYAPPCYVLERLTFLDSKALEKAKQELIEVTQGTYEPVHFFMDGNCNPLPVSWPVVDHIMWVLHHGPDRPKTNRSEALEQQQIDEVAELEAQFGEVGRSSLFTGEIPAVVYDSTKQKSWSRPIPVKTPLDLTARR